MNASSLRTLADAYMNPGRGVTCIYIGYKKVGGIQTTTPSIVFGVEVKKPLAELSAEEVIPRAFLGTQTDVVETGKIIAYARTDRVRPTPGGYSIGHPRVTAGTLGAWVDWAGDPVILTNNHVGANENDAQLGDPILQPGVYDGGTEPIATLAAFRPLNFAGGDNVMDVALARANGPEYVAASIEGVGALSGLTELGLGTLVRKSGRTTELTYGQIVGTNAIVDVQYGGGKIARFVEQLVVGGGEFSAPGDSGSAVVDDRNRLGGLLFAGGDNDTIVNPIGPIVEAFGISVPDTPLPPPVPNPPPTAPGFSLWLYVVGAIALIVIWLLLRLFGATITVAP